jgi:hypothetical protein
VRRQARFTHGCRKHTINERANLFAGGGYRWNSNGEEYNFGLGRG